MHKQLLTLPDWCPASPSKQWKIDEFPLLSRILFCMMSYGIEYSFGQLKSDVLILIYPMSLNHSITLLAAEKTGKALALYNTL